jgi:hypothetical protein
MNYRIVPLQGVDELKFGNSVDDVRSRLGSEFKSFKRSQDMAIPCDCFKKLGVIIYYKSTGELEALEFTPVANPIFDGVELLKIPFAEARALLRARDPALEEDAEGAVSHAVGIGLYAPAAEADPTAPCESVIVFSEGYYS